VISELKRAPRPRSVPVLAILIAAGIAALEPAYAQPEEEEEEEEELLRERLTERVDRRRPPKPNSVDIAGRPLTVTGEYAFELNYLRDAASQPSPGPRLVLEQGPEMESFYTFGPALSLFAAVNFGARSDLLNGSSSSDRVFLERGEMWIYSQPIAGVPFSLEAGRLHFEDDRRWWWDEERDAVRTEFDLGAFGFVLALARELAPETTTTGGIAPEEDGVVRTFAEASWDWHPDHEIELFFLHQHDGSDTEPVGAIVSPSNTDESDAQLSWLGLRLSGAFESRGGHVAGYWLDVGRVFGEEWIVEYSEQSATASVVDSKRRTDVEGWGSDVGVGWIMPYRLEPRIYAAYAFGSGDSLPDDGTDRSYRQTGLQNNEAGFGGAERFNAYGVLLEPELSNLSVLTLGTGVRLLRSSSLDLVYHRYRLDEPATELRDANIQTNLNGIDRTFGEEVDLVLALEEWERFEVQFRASAFKAGPAFGAAEGDWSYSGFLALKLLF